VLGRFQEEHWNERDLRTEMAVAAPVSLLTGVMRDQDILSREAIEGSDYYRGFARPAGVGYFAAALLAGGPADFIAISLQRDQRHGFITDDEKARLEALLPALRRSARLALVLRERAIETLFSIHPDSNAILLLLDGNGRVRRGEEAVEKLGALGLDIAQGMLKARNAQSDRAIAEVLAALQSGMATEIITSDAAGRPLARLSFSPVAGKAHDFFGLGGILLSISAIENPLRDIQLVSRLARLFNLSAAEQRVLLPLLSGADTDEIAQASGYTRESTRTWIKSILMKSGCSSRVSLMAFARRFENS